jgi:hypothetical protein
MGLAVMMVVVMVVRAVSAVVVQKLDDTQVTAF